MRLSPMRKIKYIVGFIFRLILFIFVLSIPDLIHYIYFPILILEKEPVFSLFECSVLNKGTTGTIFITSLVWHGPWLGIEPGTSRTRSQHYTTRLSRRRCNFLDLKTGSFECVTVHQKGIFKAPENGSTQNWMELWWLIL